MSEPTEQQLLDAVRTTSQRSREAWQAMQDRSADRSKAVKAAMDAGLARDKIAEAAGTHRNVLYQIVNGRKK